jgi:Xaa-Pro dipeptidase
MHAVIFTAGGGNPGEEFIVGSAADALLCWHKSGRRKLSADDQLTLEFAGVSRRYHAAIMRTQVVGRPKPRCVADRAAARAALLACQAELHPGWTAGEMFAANAPCVRRPPPRAPQAQRLRLYSLGAKFTPSWMDLPMF